MAPLDLDIAAAELALLKMALRAFLARVSDDDAFVDGVRVEFDRTEFTVELLDAHGRPVGGMTL